MFQENVKKGDFDRRRLCTW